MSLRSKLHRFFGLTLAVGVIAVLACVWSDRRGGGVFDPIGPECPIAWATYTYYPTNHTIYRRHGHLMSSQRLGPFLYWADLAALKVANRGIFGIACQSYPNPALYVFVGLKRERRADSEISLCARLVEPSGKGKRTTRCTGVWARADKSEKVYGLAPPTGALRGCVVEFIPIRGDDPVAKLRL